eukprot:scaffold246786_cov23-Tisochrysis_lutea.AAC.2
MHNRSTAEAQQWHNSCKHTYAQWRQNYALAHQCTTVSVLRPCTRMHNDVSVKPSHNDVQKPQDCVFALQCMRAQGFHFPSKVTGGG